MYTVEIFFTYFAIWVKISPLGGGAHKISVQKQVRTAAQGLVLIFAKVVYDKSNSLKTVAFCFVGGIIISIKQISVCLYQVVYE